MKSKFRALKPWLSISYLKRRICFREMTTRSVSRENSKILGDLREIDKLYNLEAHLSGTQGGKLVVIDFKAIKEAKGPSVERKGNQGNWEHIVYGWGASLEKSTIRDFIIGRNQTSWGFGAKRISSKRNFRSMPSQFPTP